MEAEEPPTELPNLITCGSDAECERLWLLAKDYVKGQATVPVESSSTDIVMTAPPETNNDIALTVSRIWNKQGTGASIFLDIQCRTYSAGMENCATRERQQVLDGFKPAVEAAATQAAAR